MKVLMEGYNGQFCEVSDDIMNKLDLSKNYSVSIPPEYTQPPNNAVSSVVRSLSYCVLFPDHTKAFADEHCNIAPHTVALSASVSVGRMFYHYYKRGALPFIVSGGRTSGLQRR